MLTMQYADPYAFCAFWATQAARALTLNTRSAIKYKKASAAAPECFAAAKTGLSREHYEDSIARPPSRSGCNWHVGPVRAPCLLPSLTRFNSARLLLSNTGAFGSQPML